MTECFNALSNQRFSGPVSSPGQQGGFLHHGLFSGIKVQSTFIQTQEFSYALGPIQVTIFIDDLQRTVENGYVDSPMNTSTIKFCVILLTFLLTNLSQ